MPYKDNTTKRKKNKIYYLRWCIKYGKTGWIGSKFHRDLRQDEIEDRKARLEALLAARPTMEGAAELRALGIGPTPCVQPESTRPELTEPTFAPGTHDLYIMQNSRIPGELKIGYSKDVERRRKELEAGQNFKMIVLATFPGKGYLEKEVHNHLKEFKVTEGPGNEWFKCSHFVAVAVINQVISCA